MAQQAPAATQGNGGRLAGVPPSMFTGDHAESERFVQELNMYFSLNTGNELVDNPMKKTLLALGHIRGELIDDWVDIQHNWINEQNAPSNPLTNHVQVPSTDNVYWTHFITEFNQAFANSTEKQNATAKLHTLHMEEKRP
jgi:hypothetical protein